MGYYASTEGADFLIEQNNLPLVMDAFNKKYGNKDWAKNCKDIFDVFSCLGLSVEINKETGDLNDVFFEYGKYSAFEEAFFDLIAPYVAEGSYVLFSGEDSSHWAFYFDGESCEEYYGEVVYPGMPKLHGPLYYLRKKAEAEKAADIDPDALMDMVGGVRHGND